MVRSTRFSWDDLEPDDRPRLNSAFDNPDDDDWDLEPDEPPVRRSPDSKRISKDKSSAED